MGPSAKNSQRSLGKRSAPWAFHDAVVTRRAAHVVSLPDREAKTPSLRPEYLAREFQCSRSQAPMACAQVAGIAGKAFCLAVKSSSPARDSMFLAITTRQALPSS
ncbi:MAG: hypothetical protein H7Y19_06600 [Luteimonas sp.]|nr:hypothetical protein [Luteimonas sp.]